MNDVTVLILIVLPCVDFPVKLDKALGAYTVRKRCLGAFGDIGIDLLPVTVVIPLSSISSATISLYGWR